VSSTLPPAIDDDFRHLEQRVREVCRVADSVEDSVDALIESNPAINFDEDDPSLVRRIEDLKRTARGSSPGPDSTVESVDHDGRTDG